VSELWFGRDGAEEEARVALGVDKLPEVEGTPAPTNVLVVAGGYIPETAAARAEEAEKKGERLVVAFGRYFISNVSSCACIEIDIYSFSLIFLLVPSMASLWPSTTGQVTTSASRPTDTPTISSPQSTTRRK